MDPASPDLIVVNVVVEVTEERTCAWTLNRAKVIEAGYDPTDPASLKQFLRDDRDYDEIVDAMCSRAIPNGSAFDRADIERVEIP